MKPELEKSLRSYLVELVVYAALVAVYYFLVLHFMGPWLAEFYKSNRKSYAVLALSLILAQGLMLEIVTRWLLAWLKPHGEER